MKFDRDMRVDGVRLVLTATIVLGVALAAPKPIAFDDALQRSKALYVSLHSYADTGSVDVEFGPAASPVREHHTFTTFYRAPRRFYFDFKKEKGVDRFVVWSDDQAFHMWWQQAALNETYGKGQGSSAFTNGSVPTLQTINLVPSWLFAAAGLTGTLTEFGDITATETDAVGGHKCLKLTGTAKSVYQATQHVANVRKTIVWIDADSLLVRKVSEDWSGGAGGSVNRRTVTLEPQANPALDDARFTFTPPTGRQ